MRALPYASTSSMLFAIIFEFDFRDFINWVRGQAKVEKSFKKECYLIPDHFL